MVGEGNVRHHDKMLGNPCIFVTGVDRTDAVEKKRLRRVKSIKRAEARAHKPVADQNSEKCLGSERQLRPGKEHFHDWVLLS